MLCAKKKKRQGHIISHIMSSMSAYLEDEAPFEGSEEFGRHMRIEHGPAMRERIYVEIMMC